MGGHRAWTSGLGTYTLLVKSGDYYWRPVQACSFRNLPPSPPQDQHLVVATETGSTYGFQVCGMHVTGMLAC